MIAANAQLDLLTLGAHHATAIPIAQPTTEMGWAGWILWLPLISLIACGLCAAFRVRNKLPAWLTVGFLGSSFLVTLGLYFQYTEPVTIELFRWIDLSLGTGTDAAGFTANFSLYVDQLSLLWMLFVTGLGTLIALYASEYMESDVGAGYARFFAGVSVFLFAMSALVLGDNLLMLYLGWEGVGFASYWLIGYYYTRPSAVAAAKKAFIVNRIGDLGLALGLYLIWRTFGTIEYSELFERLGSGHHATQAGGWSVRAIPYLLMLGAFGKSAQLPLFVWLPDAMEGPTPVSALIHAATMVTAGVYLLARMFPFLALDAAAAPTVAWIGALTALVAATIGMAQYDIKRIMAYSTVSQLGYMFLGIGVLTTFGAAYHVFTHAFFKAVLFLTCGAIMHGFAGQLDLRKLSGLRQLPGWRITSYTMLYGCLCLVGFPYVTSGFFSKDAIMAQAFISGSTGLGLIALVTALLTAYYTFRVWFRVCAGPVKYELGDDHHGPDDGEGHGDHGDQHGHGEPHAPRLAINLVLVLITTGAFLAIFLKPWAREMVMGSTARNAEPHSEGHGFWQDPHKWMPVVASITTIVGIAIAWHFHLANRKAADALRSRLLANPATAWLPVAMENKWYFDEIYHGLIRLPLWIVGHALAFLDRYLVDLVIVDGIARVPRWVGRAFQPLQNGILQSYAVSMAGGVGLVALLVLYMPQVIKLLEGWLGGGGGG
ncbi:MAG: NADH-quinone oxidoreductase subunit L [Phycisphaerales bacterium]|nr:NADH-quinone oxidoreductase subunit L [Phycisphaerales bacterium]NNM27062.1 NADH-quinone oxidoreductase subunit L [Phycisphaerales bacterium]